MVGASAAPTWSLLPPSCGSASAFSEVWLPQAMGALSKSRLERGPNKHHLHGPLARLPRAVVQDEEYTRRENRLQPGRRRKGNVAASIAAFPSSQASPSPLDSRRPFFFSLSPELHFRRSRRDEVTTLTTTINNVRGRTKTHLTTFEIPHAAWAHARSSEVRGAGDVAPTW